MARESVDDCLLDHAACGRFRQTENAYSEATPGVGPGDKLGGCADVPESRYSKKNYKVNILSRNIAQSMTVIPNRNASSFTSLSRVFGVSFAMALRCSTLLMPNLLSFGAMCSKEGSQLSKSASNCNVGWDFMLLIVEPDRVAWNGEGGSAFSTGVDALYRR